MKLWPFRRQKALSGTPAVLEALSSRTFSMWPALGGSNDAMRQIRAAFATAQSAGYAWMYANSPAVRTVVDLVARNVGQLDLRLYEELSEAEREARPDHPAALSLRRPSPTQTRDQFVRAVVSDFLVHHNAYALKFRERNTGRLVLKPIPAHRVEILGDSLFDPEGYKVHRLDGSFVIVEDPLDMVHWRGWNPNDPRIGLSPLETLRDVVAEDAALQTANVELAKSGLAGPAWVFRPLDAPAWSNDARDRFEEDLTNRLRKSGKTPPVMEEGMELRNTGVSPKDADMLPTRRYALEQVCGLYGVHPASVGIGDDIDEAQKILLENVLPPYCEAFTRQLDLSVLSDEYGETEFVFEFNLDEKRMGDDRLKALTSASGRPVLLTNEARALINKPPVDGGDELVTPANVIVGDNPKPSTDVMPIQDPNRPSQDGDHREESLPAGRVKQLEVSTSPRLERDLARQHRYIDEVAGKLARFYSRQANVLRHKSHGKMDLDRWDRELGVDLHVLLRSIVEREGGLYASRLGGDDFDLRQVQNYLEAAAFGAAEGINRATQRDIDDSGLEAAFERAQGERVDVAAGSLGTRATVFARVEAAKQAPDADRRLKVWVKNTDRHSDLDGSSVPLDASWGGLEPGSLPGCRCSASII